MPDSTAPTQDLEDDNAPMIATSPSRNRTAASMPTATGCEGPGPVSLGRHSRSPTDRDDDSRDARHPTIRVAAAGKPSVSVVRANFYSWNARPH
jgi:hypothetical protein